MNHVSCIDIFVEISKYPSHIGFPILRSPGIEGFDSYPICSFIIGLAVRPRFLIRPIIRPRIFGGLGYSGKRKGTENACNEYVFLHGIYV